MPRRNSAVKIKHVRSARSRLPGLKSLGAVDLHFHGAFGIDLMTADFDELNRLSTLLWKAGVAAFCPTTLSVAEPELLRAVSRIGQWIRKRPPSAGAVPLGIHLEGPFISPGAAGAHPPGTIRPLKMSELSRLWEASGHTLKILTLAPETLSRSALVRLIRWCREREIILSLGHSHATEAQAKMAFDLGVRGVTHAWNALRFHHLSPGALGAAIGRKDVYLELIVDCIHLDPTVIRWTRKLHGPERICYVSDCAPAAATSGKQHPFGPLRVEYKKGACRLPGGALAGGGHLLTESYARWLSLEAAQTGANAEDLLRTTLQAITTAPLKALGIPLARLRGKEVRWARNSLSDSPDRLYRPIPLLF